MLITLAISVVRNPASQNIDTFPEPVEYNICQSLLELRGFMNIIRKISNEGCVWRAVRKVIGPNLLFLFTLIRPLLMVIVDLNFLGKVSVQGLIIATLFGPDGVVVCVLVRGAGIGPTLHIFCNR